MFIFACAGLDFFVKQLVKTKLPRLILVDKEAEGKFKEFVIRNLKKGDKEILSTIALALIDRSPREMLVNEYVESMTGESLQSVSELFKISNASGLDSKKIFTSAKENLLKGAFIARNEIIHEMDINMSATSLRTTGYRTRRQRVAPTMEKYTKAILDLAEEFLVAYKDKYQKYKIEIEKEVGTTKVI